MDQPKAIMSLFSDECYYVFDKYEAASWLTRELDGRATITPLQLDKWRQRGEGPEWRRVGRFIRYSYDGLAAFAEALRATDQPE